MEEVKGASEGGKSAFRSRLFHRRQEEGKHHRLAKRKVLVLVLVHVLHTLAWRLSGVEQAPSSLLYSSITGPVFFCFVCYHGRPLAGGGEVR